MNYLLKLIELNYKVILRPHPEIGKRFQNKINEVKKFCFISSNTVYPASDKPVTEDDTNFEFFDKCFNVWL